VHGWCAKAPGRFIPLAILPLWDIDACVAEARRVAKLGEAQQEGNDQQGGQRGECAGARALEGCVLVVYAHEETG